MLTGIVRMVPITLVPNSLRFVLLITPANSLLPAIEASLTSITCALILSTLVVVFGSVLSEQAWVRPSISTAANNPFVRVLIMVRSFIDFYYENGLYGFLKNGVRAQFLRDTLVVLLIRNIGTELEDDQADLLVSKFLLQVNR